MIAICSGCLYGSDFRGFDHFQAPGFVGAYSYDWSPLGITDKGFDFCVGFYFAGTSESSPECFWIGKKTRKLVEVNSISAVNNVIAEAFGDVVSNNNPQKSVVAIEGARHLLSTLVTSDGQTGLALYFDFPFEVPEDLFRVVSRLKKAGLDETTANLLLRLGKESSVTENVAAKKWSTIWYEIDRLGGIERVTVQGSLEPVKVISVLHEIIFDAGKVNPGLLKRSNFFDPTLLR